MREQREKQAESKAKQARITLLYGWDTTDKFEVFHPYNRVILVIEGPRDGHGDSLRGGQDERQDLRNLHGGLSDQIK